MLVLETERLKIADATKFYQSGFQLSRCNVSAIQKQCTNNNSCGNATHIRIPDGTRTIEQNAFKDNTNIISVVIPNSVTSIGRFAFFGCTSIR